MDAHRTRVYCWLLVEPVGLMEGLLAGPSLNDAMANRSVQRLVDWLPAPSRLPLPDESETPRPRSDPAVPTTAAP